MKKSMIVAAFAMVLMLGIVSASNKGGVGTVLADESPTSTESDGETTTTGSDEEGTTGSDEEGTTGSNEEGTTGSNEEGGSSTTEAPAATKTETTPSTESKPGAETKPSTETPGTTPTKPSTETPGTTPTKPSTQTPGGNQGNAQQTTAPTTAAAEAPETHAEAVATREDGTKIYDSVSVALEKESGNGGELVIASEKKIGSDALKQVAAKGKKLSVSVSGGSWHFTSLTNTGIEFNPKMSVNAEVPAISSKLKAANVKGTVISFEHSGALPGTAHVGIGVSYPKGTTLYFYYYNPNTNGFEYQQSTRVEEGGFAVVVLTHCSDYVLTDTPLGPIPTNAPTSTGAGSAAGRRTLDATPHTGI